MIIAPKLEGYTWRHGRKIKAATICDAKRHFKTAKRREMFFFLSRATNSQLEVFNQQKRGKKFGFFMIKEKLINLKAFSATETKGSNRQHITE
jgi:hypothetical protein